VANKARVAWEPGNTLPSGDMLNAAIVTGKASAICYQVGFYDDAVAIPFSQQKTMLRDNYQKYFWPLVQP
jgi:uncharacterized protein YhfF